MGGLALERFLARVLVVCFGRGMGMAVRMGGLMAVVTVVMKGTWIGEGFSSSSDS